jgi:cation diffusion facilitator family transporter
MVRGGLAAAGLAPVGALAVHAAWGVPLSLLLMVAVLPAALGAVLAGIAHPELGRDALLGWLAGVLATVPYDALRWGALGLGVVSGDPVPGWGEALGAEDQALAGYAFRYLGDGGGLGLTLGVLGGHRVRTATAWGSAVGLGLFAWLALFPAASETLFLLEGESIAVVGAGHLVWGASCGGLLVALRRIRWTSTGRMALVVGLNGALVVAEIAMAWSSGSFALGGEAAHDVGDLVSLSVALAASLWAARPRAARSAVEAGRVSVLAAFVNGLVLLAAAAWVGLSALGTAGHHHVHHAGGAFAVAGLGLALNGLSALVLMADAREDLNARAVLLHMGADALGSLVALVATGLAWAGLHLADPVGGVVLAIGIGVSALWLLRSSAAILLVGPAPQEVQGVGSSG